MTETTHSEGDGEWLRIRAWLGDYVITEWIGSDPQYAERQEAAQRRLFGNLKFTHEVLPRSGS